MPTSRIPETLSVDTLAERLGISVWTIRSWIRQGRIPHFKLGRRILIKTDDVEAMLEGTYKPATR